MQCMNRCKIPSPRFYPPNNTKGRNNFTKLYTVLFPPPSCHSCTNNHADSPLLHYVTIQFEFSGPLCLPSSDRNQMESSRQASGRNELLQFSDRCNILLELSLGTSPSPLLPDIPHHIFFMTSGTACSSVLFTYFVFFCDSRLLSHSGCYGHVSTRHTVHYSTRVPTCQIVAIL